MTKILLVEDDKSLREIYSVRLLAEGYTLISSGDGEEALAAAIGEKPDLIISDVMMPKISGFEMLDLLRSNDATKNIPVIMLTALSSEQQRERGDRLGADRYLIKSQVGIEDIVRTVHEVLGDGGANRNLDQMQTSVAISAVHPAQSASGTSVVSPQSQASSPLFPANATESTTGSTNAAANTGDANDTTLPSANSAESGGTPSDNSDSGDNTVADLSTQSDASTSSIVGLNLGGNDTSNFPDLNQSMDNSSAEPANFQSAFNPPAATEPSKVTGQPSPELPDTPMRIPSRTVTQPGMPNSYTAASQSVADSPFASLANVEPRRPTTPTRPAQPANRASTAQTQATVTTQTVPAAQPQPTQQSQPVTQTTQIATPNQQPLNQPAQPGPTQQPANMGGMQQPAQMAQQPQSYAAPQQAQYAGQAYMAAQPAPMMQAMPQQQLQQPVAGQWGQPAMAQSTMQQPMQAQFIQQPGTMPMAGTAMAPSAPATTGLRTAVGGERVVAPPPAGTSVSPRINIDELLASADASASSSMFPGAIAN